MATTEQDMPRWTEYMRLSDMAEAENNPRGHDDRRIRGSIGRFGFVDQPVLDERTGRLVAGHGRLAQLRAMLEEGEDPPDGVTVDASGDWLWPVTRGWSSRSDTEAETVVVTLNRLAELGGWDDLDGLTSILRNADAMDPTLLDLAGFNPAELAALEELARVDTGAGEDDDDVLARTDRATWPRISAQVPPDVYDRWVGIPGDDHGDRVMAAIEAWEASR